MWGGGCSCASRRSRASPSGRGARACTRSTRRSISAERGNHLFGEEPEVVEVVQVEHLEVHGARTVVPVLTDAVDDLRWRSREVCGARDRDVTLDVGRPACYLGFVGT